MEERLRFGVIGTGRRWLRWRAALLALQGDLNVTAVHDPSPRRAAREAVPFRAAVSGGAVELIRRDDVDAVFLGETWFGLWPVEEAARLNKPVFCAAWPARDARAVADTAAVEVALWPQLRLAEQALHDALRELGPVQLIQGAYVRRAAEPGGELASDGRAVALLRCCADLMHEPPTAVPTLRSSNPDGPVYLLMDFGGARWAQLSLWTGPVVRSSCVLHVEAAGGRATLELPDRVEWRDAAGRHARQLPAGMAEIAALERFAEAVRGNEPMPLGLAAAREAETWLGGAGDRTHASG